MVNPNGHSLTTFTHGCLSSIDIAYDGVLVVLMATGIWQGITVDSWMRGIFVGKNEDFNEV